MTDINSTVLPIFNNPSDFIAFCALFVSICSFGLTIYTIWTQREHDRLSVKPLGEIHFKHVMGTFLISIKNGGLGPLIIKSIETYKEGNPRNLGWPPNTFSKDNYQTVDAFPHFLYDLEKTPILHGDSIVIFEHNFNYHNLVQLKEASCTEESLVDLIIKVQYTSIFENEVFETTYKLKKN